MQLEARPANTPTHSLPLYHLYLAALPPRLLPSLSSRASILNDSINDCLDSAFARTAHSRPRMSNYRLSEIQHPKVSSADQRQFLGALHLRRRRRRNGSLHFRQPSTVVQQQYVWRCRGSSRGRFEQLLVSDESNIPRRKVMLTR